MGNGKYHLFLPLEEPFKGHRACAHMWPKRRNNKTNITVRVFGFPSNSDSFAGPSPRVRERLVAGNNDNNKDNNNNNNNNDNNNNDNNINNN